MNGKNEVAVVQRTPLVPALTPEQEERRVCPPADIYETTESYLLLVDLPGAAKEAVTLWADRNQLVVVAVVEPHRRPGARLLVAELGAPVYHRSFTLGDGVDRSSIEARFENGVLAVKLMKKEDQKPRAIPIR
jgi:HSP20 family protein